MATSNGLFRYNQIKDKLEPFDMLEEKLKGKAYYRLLRQSADGSFWYVLNSTLYFAQRNQTDEDEYYLHHPFLHNSLIGGFEHINILDPEHLIVGTEEGFSLLSEPHKAMQFYPPNPQIRKVFFTGRRDSLMYGRSYLYDDSPLVIPYSQNCIRIVCSASNFSNLNNNQYSYRLNGGKETEWSEYNKNNSKEYTDLHEGTYTFQVRLMSHIGTAPSIASFTFRILPPWYRSPWMYLVYTVFTGCLLFYILRHINTQLKATIRIQQQKIERQEKIFKKESQLKDQKINSLEEKKPASGTEPQDRKTSTYDPEHRTQK